LAIDIFIRSYFRDFRWLRLSLMSIRAFAAGYRQVVLVLPATSRERMGDGLIPDGLPLRLVFCPDYIDDYLGQQVTKLLADEITDADYLLHLDADCIFIRSIECDRYFLPDGRPMHLFRSRSLRPPSDGWCQSARRVVGYEGALEFMVALPALYPRWIYGDLRRTCRERLGCNLTDYVLRQCADNFSEFTVLGAFARQQYLNFFDWREPDDLPDWPCIQFWGRAGLTPDILARLPREITDADPCQRCPSR
jgi:hypothetical protein